MNYLSIEEIVSASKGNLTSKSEEVKSINELVIDSRLANKNSAFFALVGESVDAHKFINSAIENGCKTIVKNKDNNIEINSENVNVIEVENTLFAFGDVAKHYKEKFDIPYIGVTGSVGKTSTRDMIYAVVSSKYKTLKNMKNLNTETGVPMTLTNLDESYECAVIEMGMSGFHEIEYLVNIVNPKIGVISNIGLSHIEMLGSREGIFKAKMEITTNFDEDSTLIVNGDDDMLTTLKGQDLKYNLKTFGFGKDNTIYCVDFNMNDNDTTFNAMIDGKVEEFYIPTVGEHNIYNAMAAILVGQTLGISLDDIKRGLKNFEITKSRMDVIKTDDYAVIDSVYNASVDSMNAALKVLNRYETRKVAILGDMFEMGSYAEFGHREVGKFASQYADILIAIGNDAKFMVEEAIKNGMNKENIHYFETKELAMESLKDILQKGDTILVKGSRGMYLEKVVEFLTK
ncbi:MAG: UDP-N-acetylmuramoyl-tripeptide--D-alanyl-D-alanine ligase [Intestinibacter sp.]|uniref:UDP-N-acetylmuramoyl-tripeptide--D-alanyl-D- alanine ligase n=1 Tax=Intestinibacter sp. TaxID=1965304 RepID=UPI002A834D6D|nr:UDP-N-acetylmuramoyl-tripeptide--D-alanyl-D-alanine ligase [Intestinibacter sp.]MDY4575724.1 UDP-N-acetylmuramoyl-tripeptide--D-alanyl-D-alanine ligase [Intestinibacter sp.]